MYTDKNEFKKILCEFCADPAKITKKIKAPYWPFETISLIAYCYECYQEIVKGQLPNVTGPTTQSRRGSGIKKRERLKD